MVRKGWLGGRLPCGWGRKASPWSSPEIPWPATTSNIPRRRTDCGRKRPRLFETAHQRSLAQLRLFKLYALGEAGWLKALKLEGYTLRKSGQPQAPQQALFAYTTEAT